MFGRLAAHAVPVDDPFSELAKVAGEVVAWKEFCAGRIEQLEELSSQDAKGTEQIDSEIALFERALAMCVSTLATIAKLDIEERMARVNERQAEVVVRAVEAGIAAAGLADRTDTERVRTAVARELRAAS